MFCYYFDILVKVDVGKVVERLEIAEKAIGQDLRNLQPRYCHFPLLSCLYNFENLRPHIPSQLFDPRYDYL